MQSHDSNLDDKLKLPMEKTMNKGQWLDDLLEEIEWTAADLSRATGLDSAVISNIRSGKRGTGIDVARKIAKATKHPEQEIFQRAGIWNEKEPPDDGLLSRINHLYLTLKDPSNKARALQCFEHSSPSWFRIRWGSCVFRVCNDQTHDRH